MANKKRKAPTLGQLVSWLIAHGHKKANIDAAKNKEKNDIIKTVKELHKHNNKK